MNQVNTDEQKIPAAISADDIGWQKFAWNWAHGIFILVSTIQQIGAGMFLMILILSKASEYWIQLEEDDKKLNRYYLVSSFIFILMSLRIIIFGL
jgi:hypothetical protein